MGNIGDLGIWRHHILDDLMGIYQHFTTIYGEHGPRKKHRFSEKLTWLVRSWMVFHQVMAGNSPSQTEVAGKIIELNGGSSSVTFLITGWYF